MRLLILVSLYSSPPINIRICPVFRMAQYPPDSAYMSWRRLVQNSSTLADKTMSAHWSLALRSTTSVAVHSLLTSHFSPPPSLLAALASRRSELFGSLALSLSMRFVVALIGTMVVLDLFWWVASARIAKPSFARIVVAIFALAQLAGLSWLLAQRFTHAESTALFSKFAMA